MKKSEYLQTKKEIQESIENHKNEAYALDAIIDDIKDEATKERKTRMFEFHHDAMLREMKELRQLRKENEY